MLGFKDLIKIILVFFFFALKFFRVLFFFFKFQKNSKILAHNLYFDFNIENMENFEVYLILILSLL